VNREEALLLAKENLKKEYMMKHVLAVEAIMRTIAEHLNEDKEKWGLVGILHDVDYERLDFSKPDGAKQHGIMSAEMLEGKVDDEVLQSIKSHNFENTGVEPKTKMDYGLIAADAISGLIVSCALVMPSKKLAEVKPESVVRRYKEKDFARNCSRERIYFCEKLGIDRVKFAEIALKALQNISDSLGL